MGNYEEAKRFNGLFVLHAGLTLLTYLPALLIDKEPTNMQALSLAQLIERAVTKGARHPIALSSR